MKRLLLTALLAWSSIGICVAAAVGTAAPQHRYLVERSFPQGALDHLDAEAKAAVNHTNTRFGVRWIVSYANADRTRTYCIYEGPSEAAIRDAANANHMGVDAITEVPVTIDAE